MPFDSSVLLVVVAVMIVLFLTEKLPVDLTAVSGLIALTLLGFIPPKEAFSGFSSPAIITMISTFFIGAGLKNTGVADKFAGAIHRVARGSEPVTVTMVMLSAALFSAFMNNIAATALLLPAVAGLSEYSKIAPSRLLMPLSFGAILGGMTTLIGTPPNIIIADVMTASGVSPFGFFDFFPIGLALVITGTVYMTLVGRRLLPRRHGARKFYKERGNLPELYNLYERIFTVKIPRGSALSGQTIASLRFGSKLGIQVIAIIRAGKKHLAPGADQILKGGDLLICRGRISDLEQLMRFQGLKVTRLANLDQYNFSGKLTGTSVRVSGRTFENMSIRQIKLRDTFGLRVVGIKRDEKIIYKDLPQVLLKRGDILFGFVESQKLDRLKNHPDLELVEEDLSLKTILHDGLFIVEIPEQSRLAGATLRESRMGELIGLTAVGSVISDLINLEVSGDYEIAAGDKLLVAGDSREIEWLGKLGHLKVSSEVPDAELESDSIAVTEVVLSPRSKLIGKTLSEVKFRDKYDFQVLALWREGRPYRSRLVNLPLQFGDALLLQGPRRKIGVLADNPDFVLLSDIKRSEHKPHKAPVALLSLLVMLVLSVFDFQPVHVAAFCAAVLIVAGGALNMEQGYRSVEWRVVFLVAALIPIGLAVERSGAGTAVAKAVIGMVGDYGPRGVLLGISLLSSLVSQTLDGSLTVVLLGPVTIQTTRSLALNPEPFLAAVALSASIAFLTPFSHKANLLVMAAAGYRVKDYFKVGLGLSLISFMVLVLLAPYIFPY
ncbi:MAG: hypothetical protein D6719_08650 [Candidatus Dadabacteria bacterium]|nr:MAG: hypothetical protein D6719_08650 [Candidatus Dadabacteria bacterium]